MTGLFNVFRRNIKLFFKDKGMFFSSLITPIILLVLYATFLANIYKQSFSSALPQGVIVPQELLDGTVVCQLVASLLAVCCVTVSFCANLLMINDRANKTVIDFKVSPVKHGTLAIGYYLASAASTLIITLTALAVSLGYVAIKGWYLSVVDVFCVIGDVFMLTLFGTALSSCINFFLTTNGQASAVGTVISAGYGFLCGAYMPISNFSKGLRNVLMYLPGTYGTSLVRNHMMRGVFAEMEACGFPKDVMTGIRDSIDCNLYFNSNAVSVNTMAAVLIGSVLLFTGIFVLMNILTKNKK